MKELLTLLSLVPPTEDILKEARGKYYLPRNWQEAQKIAKQYKG